MKIEQETFTYIHAILETAQLMKINNIVIEPGKIRGMEENRLVVICHGDNVPNMPFNSIGINDAAALMSRFDVVRSVGDIEVDAVMDQHNQFVRSLTMKGKGIKVDFRCANPATIRAPKEIADPIRYEIVMTPTAVNMIAKGTVALSTDEVSLVGTEDSVMLKFEDVNRDAMEYKFSESLKMIDPEGEGGGFDRTYPVKVLLPLLKHAPSCTIHITRKGFIKLSVNGFTVFVPPKE